jgi:hypothetical protein
MCEYLKITPEEFFDQNIEHPLLLNETIAELEKMDSSKLEHILAISRDINAVKESSKNKR